MNINIHKTLDESQMPLVSWKKPDWKGHIIQFHLHGILLFYLIYLLWVFLRQVVPATIATVITLGFLYYKLEFGLTHR